MPVMASAVEAARLQTFFQNLGAVPFRTEIELMGHGLPELVELLGYSKGDLHFEYLIDGPRCVGRMILCRCSMGSWMRCASTCRGQGQPVDGVRAGSAIHPKRLTPSAART